MAGRILVLDDEENYAEMLQDLLRENGYRVDMATRPERAIAQLEEIPYDLVISDYKMPVMDGADLLKRARDLYPGLPFILVSGLMNTPELVKVANMSVTLVLEKPLDTRAFLDQVSRFSSPMTEKERAQFANEGLTAHGETVAAGFPKEPQFFSAQNPRVNEFLQLLWSVAQKGSEIFILESPGGDAELLVKDLSNWRGNEDRPVSELKLPETMEAGLRQIKGVLEDPDKSRVVGVRLASLSEIPLARRLGAAVRQLVEGAESVLLVHIIAGGADAVEEFKRSTGRDGAILPEMRVRPSDAAAYAQRFARIAADRSENKRCVEFTPKMILSLLAYEWPENYRQIRKVIYRMVESNGDAPIDLARFCEALPGEIDTNQEVSLSSLMKAQQGYFLKDYLSQGGVSLADLCKELDIDPIETLDELDNLPLQVSGVDTF